MQRKILRALFIFMLNWPMSVVAKQLPLDFVYLRSIDPSIKQQIAYASSNNFVGHVIPGYNKAECILTERAAKGLQEIQQELIKQNLSLLVYDCYRPERSVLYFYHWSKDLANQKNKQHYYPDIPKEQLFLDGYIALYSGHSRGSTADLTIIDLQTGVPLDMGSTFDFLGRQSHLDYAKLTSEQIKNRAFLHKIMIQHGFEPYEKEWWHFTLNNEPHPDEYFDFVVA